MEQSQYTSSPAPENKGNRTLIIIIIILLALCCCCVVGVVGGLSLWGPEIESIFEDITRELETSQLPALWPMLV